MTVLGVILAGGLSRRMGNTDKAEMRVNGLRLTDHVANRLRPQVDETILSGRRDYGLSVEIVPDTDYAVAGPAGGVLSVARWLSINRSNITGFLTVPVDGPSFPADFAVRMIGVDAAIAADDAGLHPTFAWWPVAGLLAANGGISYNGEVSLKMLAIATQARHVTWRQPGAFINLNTPKDVAAWARKHTETKSVTIKADHGAAAT